MNKLPNWLSQLLLTAASVGMFVGIAWLLTPAGAPMSRFWWTLLAVFAVPLGIYFVFAAIFIAMMMIAKKKDPRP